MNDNGSRRLRWLERFEAPGLTRTQERVLNAVLLVIVVLFSSGWGIVLVGAAREGVPPGVSQDLARSPLSSRSPPPATFLLDRLVRATRSGEWRGRSGAVRAIITEPGRRIDLADTLGIDPLALDTAGGARVEALPADAQTAAAGEDAPDAAPEADDEAVAPERPGVYNLALRLRNQVQQIADAVLLNPVPSDLIRDGRIGDYRIGEWPARGDRPARLRTAKYDAPSGLIAVTPENRDVPVSDHLTLGDFLTKGQEDVWPKYVAITPEVLDKVELTLQELERRGHPVENVGVISGFRTPWYNAHGGATGGRGSVSRHMYGDALDFYIDNDGDGQMDDLNGDGRVTIADARIIARAAEAVEKRYPEYIGGIGTYNPRPGAHSGFVHVDARGYRARW